MQFYVLQEKNNGQDYEGESPYKNFFIYFRYFSSDF